MGSRVVSTKLSIDEHGKFLQICRIQNCTPSSLIKNLILNLITSLEKNESLSYQKNQTPFTLKNESQFPQFLLNEATISELIKKIDNDKVNIEDLNQLYLKLGEKFEKTGLSKSEELLYRKTHQKLKEKLQCKSLVQCLQQNKPRQEEKRIDEKNMSIEERFQYF